MAESGEKNRRKTLRLDNETREMLEEMGRELYPFAQRTDSMIVSALIHERYAKFLRSRERKQEKEQG